MELSEKFLPIGSVVLLNNDNTKKIMITGFCSVADDNKETLYDYSGCLYPEGYLSSDSVVLFNHDQIKELIYTGYKCEEEEKFKQVLNEIVEKYNSGQIQIEDDNEEELEDDDEESTDEEDIDKEIEDLEYL